MSRFRLSNLKGLSVILSLSLSAAVTAQTDVIAHRGGASLAPENTMAAFRKAIDLKADWFELDVWISADDSLVVIHDGRLNRTTNGTGSVESKTFLELRGLDAGSWFDPEFTGEKIPSLREALLLARESADDIGVVIEIKSDKNTVPSAIVDLVRDLDMEDRVIVSGFSFDQVCLAKSLAPEIPVQLFGHITEKDIDRMAAIHGEWVGTGGKPAEELIEYAHRREILVNAWTLNSENAIRHALELGIDAITTDKPGFAMELRGDPYSR